jgi:hypothetical protein
VLIIPRRYLSRVQRALPEFFKQYGFPVEVEPAVDQLEHIDFCQTRPVTDGEHWYMVRDPRICLDKDACTLKPVRTEADWNVLRNTVGMSGLALAGHMPVFSAFYEALRRGAGERVDKDLTLSGFKVLAKGMNCRGRPVTTAARASFYAAFGISPTEQRVVEDHYARIRPVWREPQMDRGVLESTPVGIIMGSSF